jgi:Flp pilus assembly protein TadD
MSLLQDALRRLEMERASPALVAAAPIAPATPVLTAPVRIAADSPRPRSALLVAAALFASGLAGAVLGAAKIQIVLPAAQAQVPVPMAPPASAPAPGPTPPILPNITELPPPPPAPTAGAPFGPPAPASTARTQPAAPTAAVPAARTAPKTSVPHPKPPGRRARSAASIRQAAARHAAAQRELLSDFNQGDEALAAGDWEGAEKKFRAVVGEQPQAVEGWNNLGVALLRQKKVAPAREAFDRAIGLSPGYPAALQNAGLLLLEEGQPQEAAELFRRAVVADPSAVAPRVNLAIALTRGGRVSQALEVLSEARGRFGGDPDFLYHLGTTSERAGDTDQAAEAYRAFLAASHGARPAQEQAVRHRLEAWGMLR